MLPDRRKRTRAAKAGSLVLAFSLVPVAATAQEVHGAVTLYGWLPGLEADVTSGSGGISASTSVSATKILDALNFAFMAAGELHYGQFGLLQDVVYADLGASGNLSGPLASKVNVETTMLISTTALAYRAYDEGGWLVEPFAGARYVSLEQDVKITGGGPLGIEKAASVDLDWWDPVIGLRARGSCRSVRPTQPCWSSRNSWIPRRSGSPGTQPPSTSPPGWISATSRWSSRRRPTCSASSTIIGSSTSRISAMPDPTRARAAST